MVFHPQFARKKAGASAAANGAPRVLAGHLAARSAISRRAAAPFGLVAVEDARRSIAAVALFTFADAR